MGAFRGLFARDEYRLVSGARLRGRFTDPEYRDAIVRECEARGASRREIMNLINFLPSRRQNLSILGGEIEKVANWPAFWAHEPTVEGFDTLLCAYFALRLTLDNTEYARATNRDAAYVDDARTRWRQIEAAHRREEADREERARRVEAEARRAAVERATIARRLEDERLEREVELTIRARLERERLEVQLRASERASTIDSIQDNASRAVRSLEALPDLLSAASKASEDAERFYVDGAFSPFWSAIEKGYSLWGEFVESVVAIDDAATKHALLLDKLVQLGGDAEPLAEFPVPPLPERSVQNCDELGTKLAQQVYEAQKHPVFAQIWEQRRTTAAVVYGFRNLEQAVDGMAVMVTSSIDQMSSSLRRAHREIQQTLESAVFSADDSGRKQIGGLQELLAQSKKTTELLNYQTFGSFHYH